MSARFSAQQRKFLALAIVTLLLAVDLAISYGGTGDHDPMASTSPSMHGHFTDLEPAEIHRSKTFPRLGSIGINLTHCLHGTGSNIATCEHDVYDAALHSHENGDHYGNMYRQFTAYFADQLARSPERYPHVHGSDAEKLQQVVDLELAAHGVSADALKTVCLGKRKPLENGTDLPDGTIPGQPNLTRLPLPAQLIVSSICRFVPFLASEDIPLGWKWWQYEYHEQHTHDEEGNAYPYGMGDLYGQLTGEAGDAFGAAAHGGHSSHSGPHGLDFNTETNWIYVALSHQQKVAIINLNVVDWSKVATYEEQSGYRVLLVDDDVFYDPWTVQHYASQLLQVSRHEEAEFASAVDAVHRYCFAQAYARIGENGSNDNLTAPRALVDRDPMLAHATKYFASKTSVPEVKDPVHKDGWACFLAFTGIDVRLWHDPLFTNPFCTYDTRHLARYDALWSPGQHSRANPTRRGAGDAWRCDWFIRYIQVTNDVVVQIRRPVHVSGYDGPLRDRNGHHVLDDTPLDPDTEYIDLTRNMSIGPHDVVYNPVNGMLYLTHYWQFNDPDVRMLADWTIHAIDGNPGSPSFHNPYDTEGGPAEQSANAVPTGTPMMRGEPFIIDVGGPMDGLHPVTVDVDVRNGRVFVVNKESNTISMLVHDGSRDFTSNRAEAILSGPKRLAVEVTPDMFRFTPRDMSLYHDPDSMDLPTPQQLQGTNELRLPAEEADCHLLDGIEAMPHGGFSSARALCENGLLQVQGFNEGTVRSRLRPDVEEATRRLIEARTSWPTLVRELRDVLATDPGAFPAASERFLQTWEPHLRSENDRLFLRDGLEGIVALRPSERARVSLEMLARAEDRLIGRTEDFVNATVDAFARASAATGAVPDGPAVVAAIMGQWSAAASNGDLLGMGDARLEDTEFKLFFQEVEPIIASTFITGTPAWLAYCLTYSIDVVLQDGVFPQGKESENGIHPFHCDDVYPPHYPDATPIQVDYVGTSNHHHVFIIREPIGPLIIDWWYEIRPRLFQPFDLWINPGDGNVYVSNFGNHDNVPIMRGWIALIQNFARLPCILLSCLSVTLLPPPTGWSANLLIDMDVMPHHLNVNPYTFEVHGGHLMGSHVRNAQFEPERVSWTIPETHTMGSDIVPGSSPVPNPHPTGMAINPSTQRLFMTHFLTPRPLYNGLTDRMEDMSRYVTIMDLHNYTLIPDMVYGGDHHAVADQIRPPGFAFYEQPFYNRSMFLNVSGRPMSGSPVLTADSTQSINLFLRCTYFSVQLDEPQELRTDELGFRVRPPANQHNFTFDSGRCFNIFDMQPNVLEANVFLHGDGTTRVFPDPNPEEDRLFWEYGEEHLTFGVINLFLDPDNVPATLRVLGPHGRDRDRFVDAGVQASEELAAAWVEADTPRPAHVPQGMLTFQPVPGAALPGSQGWALEMDTSWIIESRGPLRPEDPDQMRVRVSVPLQDGGERTVEVGNWSASTVCCVGFRETRIPLGGVFDGAAGDSFRVDFEFDSIDAFENSRRGWSVVEVRVEAGSGDKLNHTYDDLPAELPGFERAGMVNVTPVTYKGQVRDAVSVRRLDDGTYAEQGRPTYGRWSFVANRTFQDAEVRPDSLVLQLSSLAGLETYPPGNLTPFYAFVGEDAYSVRVVGEGENLSYELTRPIASQVPLPTTSLVGDPVLVVVQRQDVEVPDRLGRQGQPYDEMFVEASVDGGVSWKPVWRRDSRDGAQPDAGVRRVDVTSLVHAASGVWQNLANGRPLAPQGSVQFRLRFDALDPILNDYPGWTVHAIRLVRDDRGVEVPLAPDRPLPTRAQVGAVPEWHVDDGAYRFANARGTYQGPGGEGGAHGLACRLGHGFFGTWGGSCQRGPGSALLRFMGRDLAGHVTELTHHDGRGVALVEDTFENAFFTERYWEREDRDPAGVGFPAYVLDPSPDGQGDIYPEDTPVEMIDGRFAFRMSGGDGEHFPASRAGLTEGVPEESNFFNKKTRLVTESAATISDGPEFRRAFVVAGSNPDIETLAEDFRRILLAEGMWLNASHIMQMRPPEPVKKAVDEVNRFLAQEGCHETLCLNIDAEAVVKELVRAVKMAVQLRQVGKREPIPIDEYIIEGTPDVPQVAGERLRHQFSFRRDGADVDRAEFAFDFVARHRFEDYIVESKPGLPRVDLDLLRWLLNNVTLSKLNMTNEELKKVFALANATPLGNITDDLVNDTAFLSTHTLSDLGFQVENIANLLLELAEELLAVEVPASEILNDMDRMQLSLPTWGSAFSVNVTLVRPDGSRHVLGVRDGITLDREVDLPRIDPEGDVRISIAPGADRTADVRLGFDVGRFERIRAYFDDEQADALLPVTGAYALEINTTIRSPDAPSPGMLAEVVYGDLGLYADISGANQAPDADFAWMGPVRPRAPVTLVPQRSWTPSANLEDLDGYVRAYNWTFPASVLGNVSFRNVPGLRSGAPIGLDSDASHKDDLLTNALATSYGRFARRLTLTQWGEWASLSYEASGAFVPEPTVAFPSAGAYDVTLTVTDDDGLSSSVTRRIVTGASARPPEILAEPIRSGESGALVSWQNNTGSLFLQTRGRSIDLTPLLNLTNITLDDVKRNVTLLRQRINLTNVTEFTRHEIDQAVTNGTELVNRTIHDPLWLLDILFENLLLRPGSVQVVSKDAEDATQGVRAQVLLGQMPKSSGLLLPLLANLTDLDIGFDDVRETVRMAREGRLIDPDDLSLDVNETCRRLANRTLDAGGLCDLDLENVTDLLKAGLLDPWSFRFALHPDVNGTADVNKTVVQLVVMDTGVGWVYFTVIDTIDKARNWTQIPGQVIDRVLRENITAMVDPIVPVTPYVVAARGIQSQALALSRWDPLFASLQSTLLDEDAPLPDVEALLDQLGATVDDIDGNLDDLAELAEAVGRARAGAHDYTDVLRGRIENATARSRAELDLWATHAYADVQIGPMKERLGVIEARATVNLDRADEAADFAAGQAMEAIWNLSAAFNTTREWAENWTNAIQLNDTSALEAKLDQTVNATHAAVGNVSQLIVDIYKILRQPLDDLLEPDPVGTAVRGDLSNKSIVLGYDKSLGEAFVRIDDEIVARGRVEGPLPDKVHASISFSSLANKTAEVQAFWGGRGSELRDGFNRNASQPRADNWTWTVGNHSRTWGSAVTKIVERTPLRAYEFLFAKRSPEGLRALVDANVSEAEKIADGLRELADVDLTSALPERILGIGLNGVRGLNPSELIGPSAPLARVNGPRSLQKVVSTHVAERPLAELPGAARSPWRNDDNVGYVSDMTLFGGLLQEIQVASGSPQRPSAPGMAPIVGKPFAPTIIDVRAWSRLDGAETVHVALQPSGYDGLVSHFDVFATPRPWTTFDNATGQHYVGTIPMTRSPTPLAPHIGESGWQPGVDFLVLNKTFAGSGLPDGWRYFTAQAVGRDGARSELAVPWRVPPVLLEEHFATHAARRLDNHSQVAVDRETGWINLTVDGLVTANIDSCLGDRVEVTRDWNYPHDMIAARFARGLRVQERGLDSLFMLMRALNRTINEIPLNLSAYDLPRVQLPDLSLCPSLRELVETIGNANATTLLGMINYTNKDGIVIPRETHVTTGDQRLMLGVSPLLRQLLGNLTIDLDLSDLIHGTPAAVTWRTPEATGAYHARVRFLVPGPQLGALSADTPIDRLLSLGNVGLFNAIIPGERFHLLQLGHVNESGNFTEVARVDYDPHLLAPLDPEGLVEFLDGILTLQDDPVGALVSGNLPLSYGIRAGDTTTNAEKIADARMDWWHTIDVYAPSPTADVYAVAFDGKFVGQFRTSSRLPPNALRIGGSHVPTEIIVDDVRFANAIHPPAPVAEMVKTAEAQAFSMVRWHVPEDGGSPLTDANLVRLDLDTGETEVVATAGSGFLRTLIDPASVHAPVGARLAYSVQPVNDLDDGAGLPSDLRGIVRPGFLRASADTGIRHNHQIDVADDDVLEGALTAAVGGLGEATHRAVFQVNASQVVDVHGRALDPKQVGGATFLAYALNSGEARDGAVFVLPTLEEILGILGYNRDLVSGVNRVVTIDTYQDGVDLLDQLQPGYGDYVKSAYGEDAYAGYVDGLVGSTVVVPIYCLNELIGGNDEGGFTVLGSACTDAFSEPIDFTGLCNDVSRDLEMQELPYNCWEDSIGAYVSDSTEYDTKLTSWSTQPRTDYYSQQTGIDRQATRMLAWRRYDLLPALQRDADGDFSVTLKKEQEQAPSAFATYATVEAGAWLDERLGPHAQGPLAPRDLFADGKGPAGFPWSDDVASSGRYSAHLVGRGGVASVRVPANGLATVPFDVPITFDVFIPEGKAPREIGLKISGGIADRRGEQNPGRPCSVVYGGLGGTSLVTWGEQLVRLEGNALVVDLSGELDHAADLLAPRDGFEGVAQGGVPPQRGRWVTLTFDPAQLVLEWGAKSRDDPKLLGLVIDLLYSLRGPETNLWIPPHLAAYGSIYERERPTSFVQRVDSIFAGETRDIVDYYPPYDYFIPPWKFFRFNYDKYVEPYLCGLSVGSLELFVVDGEAYVDRLGPDVAPRLRIDAGGVNG